jgi:predicted amidohydrolase
METAVTPGKDFYVADLDTRIGNVKIGIMTCYDREFPESARILMLKGAEIILTPNACGLDTMRLIQFRVRAWENALATVMTNYAESEEDDGYNGRSCAFMPNGDEILVADGKAEVKIAEVNMEKVRGYRSWSYWGNSYRRPHKYEILLSPEVEEPFIRKDGFGNTFNRLNR